MPLEGKSTAETSVAFLQHLGATYQTPLIIMWDHGPAHGGDAMRAHLNNSPGLPVPVVRLPASSPYFHAFFQGVAHRTDKVIQRCCTVLQACADALTQLPRTCHGDPTAASV